MSENKAFPLGKPVKPTFVDDENLPTLYVNSVNIRFSLEDFFLTFGTAVPPDISDASDLDKIDSIKAHALFRCAVSRSTMKQLIDLLSSLYENQSSQIEQVQAAQKKDEEYGDRDNQSS